mgnify:CR=1 FL=1
MTGCIQLHPASCIIFHESFHPENTAHYTRRLEALYTLAASDNYVRDMQICEGLFALLTLLMQESWHPEIVRTAGTKRQNVQEIKDYLDLHFAEKITLDALAELLAGAEAEPVLPLAACLLYTSPSPRD